MKTECMVRLHCVVNEWSYSIEVSINQKNDGFSLSHEKMLGLSGEVTYSGFIHQMIFDIKLICLNECSMQDYPCVLELNNAMEEYDFPEHLSVLIPVTEMQFVDLKSDFFRSSQCQSIIVRLSLDVEGLEKDNSGDEKITPVANSNMRVVRYNFEFIDNAKEGD